jgi:hypothetical protein
MGLHAFRCLVLNDIVKYGGTLRLRLEFEAERELDVGFALLGLSSMPGTFDAQSDLSDAFKAIPAGASSLEIELGPLYLRRRTYYISISIHDQSRKVTMVHGIGVGAFEFEGPIGFGLPYVIPNTRHENKNGQPLPKEVHSVME